MMPAPAAITPPEPIVELELLARLQGRAGQLWLPGERAGFSPEIADDLVERGIARRVEQAPAGAKAPDHAEKDKMLRGTTTQKK